jgi:hypothetical protein
VRHAGCTLVGHDAPDAQGRTWTARYAEHAVRHAWLVDPLLRSLEILRLSGAHWMLLEARAGNVVVHAEPFETMSLDLGTLWAEDAPPA